MVNHSLITQAKSPLHVLQNKLFLSLLLDQHNHHLRGTRHSSDHSMQRTLSATDKHLEVAVVVLVIGLLALCVAIFIVLLKYLALPELPVLLCEDPTDFRVADPVADDTSVDTNTTECDSVDTAAHLMERK